MLVFLIVTFSTVLGFLKLTNERIAADSSDALSMQIKDAMQSTLYANTLTSEAVVPIPKTLPEVSETYVSGRLKTYTVQVNMTGPIDRQVVYASIGWGGAPTAYISASSFVTSGITIDPPQGISFISEDYRYFIVKKQLAPTGTKLCFKACKTSTFTSCVGCTT
jgi:hypothetical protein